ncbi:ankyrin repeat-containing protein [Moumouvirus maliensis]|nr:ankyrin repeat-containing protein [Moumouvirus maliensis]
MEPFHFKFCLCGNPCPSVQEFTKYCLEIDGQYYFATNKQLIPIVVEENKACIRNNMIDIKYATINIDDVVNFFKYVVDKNLFIIFNDIEHIRNYSCYLNESAFQMIKYLASNNVVNILKFFCENPKYYYPNMSDVFFCGISCLSNINTMKSIIKYLPISILNHCLQHGFRGLNKQVVEYLLYKYKKYVIYFLSDKKFGRNLFYIDEIDLVYLDLEEVLECLFMYKFKRKNFIIYEYILEQFSQLENDLSQINVKNNMKEIQNKLISGLQYNNKIATNLLKRSLTYKQDKNLSLTRQFISDGGNFNYIHDETIFTIITDQNLDLLDIIYEKKIVRQCDLDYILVSSYKSKTMFVQELINYGADIDKCYDKLLRSAQIYKNIELVEFLKNYYNEE